MTIDSSSLLGDPGAYAVTNHRAWIGRKEAKLRRHLLDCGCRNLGEVFFHLWCDRLACERHADSPHDCERFKGKNGIEEEESEPVAAVVEAPYVCSHCGTVGGCNDPWTPPATITIPADQFDELMATIDEPDEMPGLQRAAERRRLTLADMEEASEAVRARRPAPPVDEPVEPEPVGADVRVMTPEEEAGYLLRQTWSLECSRARPMCSGCDGGAMDGFACMHDCHGFDALGGGAQ